MNLTRLCLLIFLLSTILWIPQALAETMTFSFSGDISTVIENTAGSLPSGIIVGTPFSGSFSFDSASTDLKQEDPTWGEYQPDGMSYSAQITIGSHSYNWDSYTEIWVWNDYPVFGEGNKWDEFTYFGQNTPSAQSLYITLWDPSHTAFSADSLPTELLLSSFDGKQIQISGPEVDAQHPPTTTRQYLIYGQLNSLSQVPEPTSLVLLGTGFAVIGIAAWRRKN